ncbi:hypothetical protein J3F84DRAFT_383557 [Trichoderma pleuroticola]
MPMPWESPHGTTTELASGRYKCSTHVAPPLLRIASWITACMNTYMHSCEAPCQHGAVSTGGLWAEEQYIRGCIDTCAPAVDASQLPEQRNTKDREAN